MKFVYLIIDTTVNNSVVKTYSSQKEAYAFLAKSNGSKYVCEKHRVITQKVKPVR